jgi:hypothetical protein
LVQRLLRKNATAPKGPTTEATLLVHETISDRILSAAYRIHSKLGPGLLERAYRVCLAHELQKQQVAFETEKAFPVEYDGVAPSWDIASISWSRIS